MKNLIIFYLTTVTLLEFYDKLILCSIKSNQKLNNLSGIFGVLLMEKIKMRHYEGQRNSC